MGDLGKKKKIRKAPRGPAVPQNACFRVFHLSHDTAKTVNCMILKLSQVLNNRFLQNLTFPFWTYLQYFAK